VRDPKAERGFTLIELMVVVAIIAILAAVVVPTFTKNAHKTRGKAEVNAMFAQIATKEEIYKEESGSYRAALTKCPATPNSAGVDFNTTCVTSGSDWEALRITAAEGKSTSNNAASSAGIRCAYTIVTGGPTDQLIPPLTFKNSAGTAGAAETNLANSWWYATAECDEDGAGATSTNAQYFMSSVNPNIQVLNSGD
jgi:prepilin-type N-terminal cleavage/methylation domain-containing protein